MFNSTSSPGSFGSFTPGKVLAGYDGADNQTHKLLYAGSDPADETRVLIKKVVQVSKKTYCYEETTITPSDSGSRPTVHTNLFRVKDLDLHEHIDGQEEEIRGRYRPLPNVMGFSLYYRDAANNVKRSSPHLSVVENTLYKATPGTWIEWFQDFRDRRDMAAYLSGRWSQFI